MPLRPRPLGRMAVGLSSGISAASQVTDVSEQIETPAAASAPAAAAHTMSNGRLVTEKLLESCGSVNACRDLDIGNRDGSVGELLLKASATEEAQALADLAALEASGAAVRWPRSCA